MPNNIIVLTNLLFSVCHKLSVFTLIIDLIQSNGWIEPTMNSCWMSSESLLNVCSRYELKTWNGQVPLRYPWLRTCQSLGNSFHSFHFFCINIGSGRSSSHGILLSHSSCLLQLSLLPEMGQRARISISETLWFPVLKCLTTGRRVLSTLQQHAF